MPVIQGNWYKIGGELSADLVPFEGQEVLAEEYDAAALKWNVSSGMNFQVPEANLLLSRRSYWQDFLYAFCTDNELAITAGVRESYDMECNLSNGNITLHDCAGNSAIIGTYITKQFLLVGFTYDVAAAALESVANAFASAQLAACLEGGG